MSSGRRRASGAVLLAACAHLCACAAAYLDYPPSMAGLYQFIGSSGGASPFFYPPPLPPYPRVSGSATFLPPWEAAAAAAEQVPGLYASRYAASALPAPAALRPWHAHAPAQTAGGAHALHEPAQRFYSGRGRPAMIPTPYAKFSKSTDKNNIIAAPTHPNARDREFMEWMSSLNPTLLSRYPTLTKQSQHKLRTLHALNQQANNAVDEVLKGINRCEEDYKALAEKNFTHLQLLGLSEDEDFSCETQSILQDVGAILSKGHVGDGTCVGSAATLAVDFLAHTEAARQKLNLIKDIKITQRKNERLKENLLYFEKEYKLATDEITNFQDTLESSAVELNFSLQNLSNLSKTNSSSRIELENHGVPTTISTHAILDLYNAYRAVMNDIQDLEKKFEHYDDLPPSITETVKIVEKTRELLESTSNTLRKKLASFHKR
ncbi:DNA repair protein RAD50 [Frankliniella fusca]|uniref:DNA repair protein RAD50 n=1 Tax=Frankliniella fusca TaxID=407009 RepID=A0AAE1LQM0_9NEOP|nr:DNA repair protein RAD50 [Frankliniella fusca]